MIMTKKIVGMGERPFKLETLNNSHAVISRVINNLLIDIPVTCNACPVSNDQISVIIVIHTSTNGKVYTNNRS